MAKKRRTNRYQEVLRLPCRPNFAPASTTSGRSHQFKKGPPKIKKWESDDLPGVIGVYYYQVYL